eukprot:1136537-Pelagomonas_calceolata.AAC.6
MEATNPAATLCQIGSGCLQHGQAGRGGPSVVPTSTTLDSLTIVHDPPVPPTKSDIATWFGDPRATQALGATRPLSHIEHLHLPVHGPWFKPDSYQEQPYGLHSATAQVEQEQQQQHAPTLLAGDNEYVLAGQVFSKVGSHSKEASKMVQTLNSAL